MPSPEHTAADPTGTHRTAVVIGGGRWGRIIAGKLAGAGFRVHLATRFPSRPGDITREDIARLPAPPDLIYVASASSEHERDFRLAEPFGIPIWMEKNFAVPTETLCGSFLSGDNGIFSQQLFNLSLDAQATPIRAASTIDITTEIESDISTHIGLFDWICHDLSLMARMLWLRGAAYPVRVESSLHAAAGTFVATCAAGGLSARITLRRSDKRRRLVRFSGGEALVSGHDGVLHSRDGPQAPDNQDLLAAALKVALASARADVRTLTGLVFDLHTSVFPRIAQLPPSAFSAGLT